MIRVRAELADEDGRFRLDVDGHEGHVLDGRVCAAVTAITQAAVIGLEHLAEMHPDLVSVEITYQEKR